jgi:hypothetical protein
MNASPSNTHTSGPPRSIKPEGSINASIIRPQPKTPSAPLASTKTPGLAHQKVADLPQIRGGRQGSLRKLSKNLGMKQSNETKSSASSVNALTFQARLLCLPTSGWGPWISLIAVSTDRFTGPDFAR